MAKLNDDHLFLAKLAEEAERYNEMKIEMKKLVETKKELSVEERNLLSVAYKNVIGDKRKSCRYLGPTLAKSNNDDLVREYVLVIENEMREIINEFMNLLEKYLIPSANRNLEAKSFYLKLKADNLRYLYEIVRDNDDEKERIISESSMAYQNAFDISRNQLGPCNPIRLGLALSYSVFFYEILNMKEQACDMAKKTFDDALMNLDSVKDEAQLRDSKLILQLLRENLVLWTQELDEIKNDN